MTTRLISAGLAGLALLLAAAAAPDKPTAPAKEPLQLSLVCDRTEYMHGEPGVRYLIAPTGTMKPALTVKNTSAAPVTLTFPSTQQVDFVIRDAKGAEVARWSKDRMFGMMLQEITLKPGEERTFSEQVKLGDVARPLPNGSYTVEGFLTAKPALTATASFRIIPTPP